MTARLPPRARPLLRAAQVASRLGHSIDWWYRNRTPLEALGFPPPVDGCGHRWDPDAIDSWLARRRAPAPANDETGGQPGGTDEEAADWAARLDRRAAALAGRPAAPSTQH